MSDLSLKIKVEGREQLDALWQKFEQGKATLKDVTQIKKDMNAAFKGEVIGTADYNKFAGQLAKINDLQRDVRIQTKAGHEAYFKAGLEVRQLALSSGLLKGALGGVTSEMANSVLNAVQLKQALTPLGVSMGGVGVGVAAAVAVLPAFISLLFQTEQRAKDAKASMDAFKEEMTSFFEGIDPEEAGRAMELTQADLNLAKTELVIAKEKAKAQFALALVTGGLTAKQSNAATALVTSLELQIEKYNATLAIQRNILAVAEQSEAVEKRKAGGTKGIAEDLKDRALADYEFNKAVFENEQAANKAEREQIKRQEDLGLRKRPGEIPLKGLLRKVEGVQAKNTGEEIGAGLEDGERSAESIASMLNQGAQSFTATLISGLLTGQDIAAQLVSILLNVGITYLTGGIKPFAAGGLISEPVIGRGVRSGSMYTFAERGPEYVVPRGGSMPGGGGFGNLQLRTEIAGSKLAVIVESGDRMNRRGRIS